MSPFYKIFKWKPWTITSNYGKDNECQRCPKCGSTSFITTVTDTVANNASEVDTHCAECGEYVNYWAYGSFHPSFKMWDRSFQMWLVRLGNFGG